MNHPEYSAEQITRAKRRYGVIALIVAVPLGLPAVLCVISQGIPGLAMMIAESLAIALPLGIAGIVVWRDRIVHPYRSAFIFAVFMGISAFLFVYAGEFASKPLQSTADSTPILSLAIGAGMGFTLAGWLFAGLHWLGNRVR